VHEKNMEMLHAGVFNDWTKKSLGRLTELMPGRYAKHEMSSGFLASIDSYVYRTPLSQQVSRPALDNAETKPAGPDQTTHPAAVVVADGGAKIDATRQNADTKPAGPDPTTHPAPTAVDNRGVKNASPQ
jgi:hypothetical protein